MMEKTNKYQIRQDLDNAFRQILSLLVRDKKIRMSQIILELPYSAETVTDAINALSKSKTIKIDVESGVPDPIVELSVNMLTSLLTYASGSVSKAISYTELADIERSKLAK